MPLSPNLLRKLDSALLAGEIHDGFHLLGRHAKILTGIAPADPCATSYLLCIVQWVDLGYRDLKLIEELIGRFASIRRSDMRLSDYLQLRMVEGFHAFASEDASSATEIFEFVLHAQEEVAEPRFAALTHFWKARAHRKKGEYEKALHHVAEAKALARKIHAPKLVAMMKIHESWLLFQSGQRREAFALLDGAEVELKVTGHALSLGNIESARGRFVRRSGEYGKALEHFRRAISIYSRQFPHHPNLARALVNAAYVKRLMALDLSHRSDAGKARGTHNARYLEICREALELLQRAKEIYAMHHHQVGIGAVLVNSGQVHLDIGNIDQASSEAIKAFRLGEEKDDHILMARARVLQADIENVRVEEQLEEAPDTAVHAARAMQYAEEAIVLARQTQNKRLLAGAYIARGLTAANDFFEEWEIAKQFASLASDLLSTEDRDHLLKELSILKARILRATGVDQTLRLWSDGVLGEKSFQQVTEEFAEIVIPKVWMREGRKISKVAEKLSISPKKVRRILRNVQLLDG